MKKFKTICVLTRERGKNGKAILVDVPEEVQTSMVIELYNSQVKRGVAMATPLRELKKLSDMEYQERVFDNNIRESRSIDDKKNFLKSKFDEFLRQMKLFNSRWLAEQFGLNKTEYSIKETFVESYDLIGGKLRLRKTDVKYA